MEEQQLQFEKVEKISQDEDFTVLSKKLLSDEEIQYITSELVFKFDAIYKKLGRDA